MEDKLLQLEKGDFKIRQLKENEAQLNKAM